MIGSKNVKFPLEYHPEILGEYAERESVQQHMDDCRSSQP